MAWLLILATGWLLAAVLVCLLFAFASPPQERE